MREEQSFLKTRESWPGRTPTCHCQGQGKGCVCVCVESGIGVGIHVGLGLRSRTLRPSMLETERQSRLKVGLGCMSLD